MWNEVIIQRVFTSKMQRKTNSEAQSCGIILTASVRRLSLRLSPPSCHSERTDCVAAAKSQSFSHVCEMKAEIMDSELLIRLPLCDIHV